MGYKDNYDKDNVIKGLVTAITPYGAFLSFTGGYTGLLHISEISNKYVRDIHNYFNVGQEIFVEIIGVHDKKLDLSIKNIEYKYTGHYRRKKIVETPKGFSTLKRLMPIWTKKKLNSIKNMVFSIDN